MTLAELQAEREELLPQLKKMKRNAGSSIVVLNKMRRRNLALKDEIVRRLQAAKTAASASPAMSMAA